MEVLLRDMRGVGTMSVSEKLQRMMCVAVFDYLFADCYRTGRILPYINRSIPPILISVERCSTQKALLVIWKGTTIRGAVEAADNYNCFPLQPLTLQHPLRLAPQIQVHGNHCQSPSMAASFAFETP
jgi:hypothetical protein